MNPSIVLLILFVAVCSAARVPFLDQNEGEEIIYSSVIFHVNSSSERAERVVYRLCVCVCVCVFSMYVLIKRKKKSKSSSLVLSCI